ncbi:MAG: MopE-related protein, partial [Myxococcota bacterium]|nr:MopE-related protein [Myxococcota bacterium]
MKADNLSFRLLLSFITALAFAGCGDDSQPGTLNGADSQSVDRDGESVADTGVGDAFVDPSDGSTPGAGADITTSSETSQTEGDGSELSCGVFGDECTSNDQCCDGYCVETFDGLQCTTSCIEECPPGWSCQVVLNSYPDVVTICVPNTSKLCRECTSDLQCNGGSCVQIGSNSEDLYCTIDCSLNACPEGFECITAGSGAQSCRPVNGTCDCNTANSGAVRPCAIQSDFGVCQGVETCEPALGWSICSANEPSAEICDGLDNDCDGAADEDFQEPAPCEATTEFGTCQGIETCQGANGLICSASQPTAEVCDFLDNDCDGTTDEDFKDENGIYGTTVHCGGCGNSCEGIFPNATAKCDVTQASPQCVVDECDDGYYASGNYQCLPELDTVCQPCTADFQCGGGVCIQVAGGSFCAKQCGAGLDNCSPGFLCQAADGPDGNPVGQACLPKSGDCGCIPSTQGQKKPCQSQNGLGTCFGFQTCEAQTGWSACDALEPGLELCDGIDNDCNGFVDDGLPPSEPCENSVAGIGQCTGLAFCQGTQGWVCSAEVPSVELCDFKDNDCDGEVDETFKDDLGKYVDQQHCGSCGVSCDGAIPNAIAECNGSLATPLCTITSCEDGFYQVNDYLCLPEGKTHCKLCSDDGQCGGLTCTAVGDGSYCTEQCTDSTDCPDGFACQSLSGQNWCVPPNGTCDCNSDTAGAKKPCNTQNDIGTCVGFETCEPATGWSSCSANAATEEICDGLDNDCNGVPDDGLPETLPCEDTNEFGTCTGSSTCAGSLGWVCNAQVPASDVCDFLDNDCDGSTDEDFVNTDGKYAFDDNCGTCGIECGDLIENSAVEACDATKSVPQCVAVECDEGYFKANDFQCIIPPDVGCTMCQSDSDCFGGSCIELLDGPHCVEPCADDADCESGFVCNGAFCLPESGSCDCTEATDGVKKLCSVENEVGTCVGFSTCNPESGWSICDAATPSVEACNGVDDDCNGIPDDGLPASLPCDNTNGFGSCAGDAYCQGAVGWICTASEPSAEACDYLDN